MFKSIDDLYEQAHALHISIHKCTVDIIDDPKTSKDDLIKAVIMGIEQFVKNCESTNQDDLDIMEFSIIHSIEHCTIDLLNNHQVTKRELRVAIYVGIDYWIKREEITINSERKVISKEICGGKTK